MSVDSTSVIASSGLEPEAASFLLDFLDVPAPSGFEGPAAERWRTYAAEFATDVREDRLGNSYATVLGSARMRVALVGHVDEIGLIVTRIDDKGFLRCTNIGGWDVAVLTGQRVRIVTEQGDVYGSIGRGAVHTLEPSVRDKAPKLVDLWIDIGAADGDEARARVQVGDPAVLDVHPRWLGEHRLMSRSLDDRLGSFAVLEAVRGCARQLADRGPEALPEIVAVGSTGEEIGAAGALTSAYSLRPDLAVVVDVTSPGDTPGADQLGNLKLGGGPIITRGATTSGRHVELLLDTAKQHDIPVQLRGMGGRTRTDADKVTRAGAGVPVILVSIPGRYLHTPCEQADMRDVRASIALLEAFLLRLAEEA